MARREDHHRDAGLITPAILVVVLVFVVVAFGAIQVGLSADRSGRVQVAADAAALAAAQSLAPAGAATPARGVPAGGGDPRGVAVRYALLNLPGLRAEGVLVTVGGRRVTVELRDDQPLSTTPLRGLRTPDNRASATAVLEATCDADSPAVPGTPCRDPLYVARLVE